MIATCMIITACIAYVYWLDAPNDIASRIVSLIFKREYRVRLRKPFGCSLCMTFWVTLTVLLIWQASAWWFAFVCAWSSKYFYFIYEVADKLFVKLFSKLSNL